MSFEWPAGDEPRHVLTAEELDAMLAPWLRGERPQMYPLPGEVVEVDNPMRREVRPRRGTEGS